MAIDFLFSDDLDIQVGSTGDYETTTTFETASVCGLWFEERDAGERGHFGFQENEGSKLWRLEQSKLTQANLNNARRFADSGLQFLLNDGLVTTVTNSVTGENNRLTLTSVVTNDDIEIEREFTL